MNISFYNRSDEKILSVNLFSFKILLILFFSTLYYLIIYKIIRDFINKYRNNSNNIFKDTNYFIISSIILTFLLILITYNII